MGRNYGRFDVYGTNKMMNVHYTDLEEDRNADFPDNREKLNTFDPFDTSNQTVGNKNTKPANSEFDYNSSLPVEKVSGSNNLVDMDACMGFNIPTNNMAAFGTGNTCNTLPSSGIVPDDQSSVKEESNLKSTVVKNPFFGKQQRLGSSNST